MRLLLAASALLAGAGVAHADPCGMVPPIYTGTGPAPAIARTGPQKTYVFFKDGVETFVIRPGFTGKVEEFGMLVPFPSPPEIRKVPDEIFAQVAAAVDPPEVVIDLRPRPMMSARSYAPSAGMASEAKKDEKLAFDEVRVLKQEAVGMYEVAVLEAGSAKALSKWMDDHGFRYPKGMDKVCNEYVAERWCFVAVKTKVGNKPATDPKPGMKKAPSADLPAGASFSGFVQAMGYRFKVEKPVVPMRLGTYNDASERRNIVYFLTEEPVKFDGMPDSLVMRQVPGKKLLHNVTKPLPLRIYGGTFADVPKPTLEAYAAQRSPAPHNGLAKELFASDLRAVRTGELTLAHEEEEKELLRVGERLGLRGPEIDRLNEAELAKQRDAIAKEEIASLADMTMTVIDGDFPLDWIRDHNLTVSGYKMPKEKNAAAKYNARLLAGEGELGGERVDDDATASNKKWYEGIWE